MRKSSIVNTASHSSFRNSSFQNLLPLPALHQLSNFSLHHIPFQCADVTYVKLAVEMVGLMQERTREQVFACLLEPSTIHILRAHRDDSRSRNVLAKLRNAQAALR